MYSLKGYFHISSEFSLDDLQQKTPVMEWLDSYNYFMKPWISQVEEMVPIGALCYSSILMFRDDLKRTF